MLLAACDPRRSMCVSCMVDFDWASAWECIALLVDIIHGSSEMEKRKEMLSISPVIIHCFLSELPKQNRCLHVASRHNHKTLS
mmetsp:Transcript_160025/g.292102  ORF Transcript_160025/g.292102 Transcript_160025/m.292102 type:complete len:83 (+) Transcript_160025:510-758(+)